VDIVLDLSGGTVQVEVEGRETIAGDGSVEPSSSIIRDPWLAAQLFSAYVGPLELIPGLTQQALHHKAQLNEGL
jgi:hypothetical protein